MIEKNQFLLLTDTIIASEFADDFEIYEFEREEIYSRLSVEATSFEEIPLNKSGVPVSEMLEYVKVILGVWAYLKTMIDAPDDIKKIKGLFAGVSKVDEANEDIQKAKEILRQSLIKKGVSEEKINKLLSKFFSQINQVLK